MAMKSYLFVLRKPAHSGNHVQEILDIVLTAAAFDQQVSLLLLDDGVFQLKNNQHPEKLAMKDTAAIFRALEIYDVKNLYVEQESLQERGLKPSDLYLSTKAVDRSNIAGFMKQFDVIFPG
ncbi:Sulfur relay protein TusC/DsrF [Crenothrix polyspora]|uniref:Sulfur relay protein TusC/DsrF n=2 Tax=Crenothrix polyspora TaxID=360316 RepID=A0A1R4H891_9GAMM|nr:Sulfur relay protein TusC/DsrF [Crenothrix polyspora]